MAIEFRCAQCGTLLRVAESSAGKNARCPGCQAVMLVPAVGDPTTRSLTPLSRPDAPPPKLPPPAPTSPGPQDALFAYLKQATTPVGPPPELPPPKPRDSYAPPQPSPAAASYPQLEPLPGERAGLPWENQPLGLASWWATTQLCLGDAEQAFRQMRQEGGLGTPMLYAGWGQLLGYFGNLLWSVPFLAFRLMAGRQNNQLPGMDITTELIGSGLLTLLFATAGLLIGAALWHCCLLLVGGATRGYETTYRVAAFTAGSIAWLSVIPFVGPLIAFVMWFVCMIQGLAQAHETSLGKAAAAVLLPMLACGGLLCAGVIAVIAILVNQ